MAIALMIAVIALLAPHRANAQAALAGTATEVCLVRAAPWMTAQQVLRGRVGMSCAPEQHRLGKGDYWVLAPALPPQAINTELRIRSGSVWQKRMTLYALYDDGTVVIERADGRALTRHIALGAIVEFALPARPARLERLAWFVEGSANVRGVLLDLRIATPAQSASANVTMATIYAAFAGLALALLVYNAALWGALRHRFQLAYCAMVSAMLVYAFSSSGALAWAMPGIANNDRLRVNFVAVVLALAAAIWFASSFFERLVMTRRLRRMCTGAIALLCAIGPVFLALVKLDVRLADAVYSWTVLACLTVPFAILWRAWRERSDYLCLFAVAWAAPLLSAIGRLLAAVHAISPGFWLDNSSLLSMVAEALLSSLAIAYRVHSLSRERDAALAGETVARRLAEIEPLTGLLNRRAFLEQAIGRTGDQTLHIADIDHFKRINETLGHDGGDEVLRVFARTLRAVVPVSALVARIGGEEFAIVTAASDPVDAETLLAQLRLARMPFDLAVTASVGTCTGSLVTEQDWTRLYRCADRALFEAKSAGRDQSRRGIPLAQAA